MKNITLVGLIPVLCISLLACSTASKNSEPLPAGYTSKGNGTFRLHAYREVTLENGLKIFFIRDTALPRVSLTMLFKTGSMQESSNKAGLNALSAYLLEQGTQTRDATKIADDFGQLGSSLDITPGADVTTVYSDALSNSALSFSELFADVIMNPAFKDSEINRLRSQFLAALQKKVDDPSSFADAKMDEFLYGNHPYGRDVNGTIQGVKGISKQDVIRHYLTFYRPNNASLAVVGKFDEKFEQHIQEVFSKWTKRSIPVITAEAPPSIEGLKVKLVVKKGLQQTQIRIAQLGIARNSPDFLSLRLANETLGGSFASRLNQKIRDDLGLTYSIGSNFDVRKERGSFEISTFTKNETAGQTLEESLKVLADFIKQGADDREVAAGRSQLIGQFPRAIETADRLAYNLMALDFYGIPVSYLVDYNQSVSSIKTKEAHAAIKRNVSSANLKVVVYGDEKIIPQFEKYKPEIERLK